ncbi:sugar kinase, partial [Klebsiella pneumoniae]
HNSQAQRDLVITMPNCACGLVTADPIDVALLNQCQHFHIMGSSLFSFRIIDAMRKAIENIKGRCGTVSVVTQV